MKGSRGGVFVANRDFIRANPIDGATKGQMGESPVLYGYREREWEMGGTRKRFHNIRK
jgi:hypothetical protein